MTENLRRITEEINHRPDRIAASYDDPAELFEAYTEAFNEDDRALAELSDEDLAAVVTAQSAPRVAPMDHLDEHPEDTVSARVASSILGTRYYARAQAMDTRAILEALAPLTAPETLAAVQELRREALVSVLTGRHPEALAPVLTPRRPVEQPPQERTERERVAAICRAAEHAIGA